MTNPFKDKTVAIVGNADVDVDADAVNGHEVVVLMNSGLEKYTDLRCDVYCSNGLFDNLGVYPHYHMSPKHRHEVGDPQTQFYDEHKWHILYNTLLGARPTTGLMVVDMVRSAGAKKITLFGFDFFETGTCAPVHCPNSEKRLLQEWGLIE